MARLRFPGRPGHRFDRLSLKYFADDIKNSQDPSLAFLPQFQRGLRSFRDIVGLSDEDDEFEGFTFEELEDGEKKLSLFNKEQQKKEKAEQSAEMEGAAMYRGTRLGNARQSLESIPATERTRVKIKTVVGKSYKDLLKDENKRPGKAEIQSVKIKGTKIFDHRKKPKKFKLDYKHGLHDIHASESKAKKSDMDMAKFLLEKAKQANKIQEQARARRLAAAKKPVQVQRKEFVLPTQSSRSSRVIKPNKRFLESDSVNTIVIKKSKLDEMVETTPEKLHGKSISERKKSLDSFRPSFSGSPNSIGLLDQPLIVDGKRDRKPSLKLQMSDDESPLFSPTKSSMTSPLAAPKLGTSLFSQSQFQKASEKQKFSMMGFSASRLHGTSIVQKAKLQLNRAALNKSKAALARSLKAEMNREAKYAEQVKQYEVDTSQMVTADQLPKEKGSEKKRLKRKSCAVCGKKTDLVVCYDKIVVCLSCRRFYKECNWLINAGTFTRPHCMQNDKCKLKPDKIKCRLCRIRKVLQVGFPPLPQLTELFKDENGVEKTGTVEEPVEVGIVASPAGKKGVRKGTPVQSPVPVVDTPSLTTPPPVLVTSEDTVKTSKEQELSPLKAGEGSEKRQRKKRAFKELLRNKQEKVEETEPVQQEKPPIQEPPSVVATGSVEISPRGGPGPRIKHVCRNAAVVLGQPLATFPEKSELRLSALPTKDKVQLWKKDEESKAANEDSDDDRPMEEIIQQSGDSVVIVKKSPTKTKVSRKLTGAGGLHIYKRRMRCRKCPGCVRQDCGVCRHCLDMKKYGGTGKIKKACFVALGERRCSNPLIQRSATEAFIVEKKKLTVEPRANSKQIVPERTRDRPEGDVAEGHSEFTPSDSLEPVIPGSEVTQTVSGLQIQTGTLLQDETQSNNNVAEKLNENIPSVSKDKYSLETRQQTAARGQGSSSRGQGSEVRKLTFEDLPNFQLERISSRNKESGKISSKLMKKLEMQQKYSKKEGGNDGQCYPVTLQSVLPASRQWGSLLSQPRYYPIKVDFKGKCDLGSAWNYGMALTMSNAMSVRTLCFLCGSAGKHELIYCNICCEPFHEFCLEDWEQPSPDHYDDWICAACQFCHVCGRQNNLLQCDKCQNTYHPGCLGPNYPTKPSKRKNIWICTKCVKCKSCGATTPGSDSQATWTYDFSLCFECGRLMDKGNFCPICRKCYSDDDWESKMIQCNMCESWVHSKCEGFTDEMYEILSYLPEDLSFYCRKCFPVGCPEWESTLKRELRLGLENILQSLILSKSSQYILKQEKKSPPKQTILPLHQTTEKQNNSCTLTNKNSSFTLMDKNNVEATQERVKRNLKSFEKIKQLLRGGTCRELTDRTKEGIGSGDAKLDTPNEGSNGTCLEITSKVEQSLHGIKVCDSVSQDTSVAMETDNCSGDNALSQTSGNVADGSRKETENLENAQNVILTVNTEKIKHSCDKARESASSSESSPSSGSCDVGLETGQCEGGNMEDKPMICDKQTVCDLNVVQGSKGETVPETINSNNDNKDVQNTEKCDPTSSEQSCSTGNNNAENSEISNSENVLDEVKTESIKVSEGNVIHTVSVDKHPSVTSQDLTVDKNAKDRIVNSTCLKEVIDNKSDSIGTAGSGSNEVVLRKSHRVQFNVVENKDTRVTGQVQQTENDYPKDLMEVAQKMKTGDYKSVAIFCEDILRVIQTYLDNEEEARTSRKKATQSAKSIFVKQLEKIFPWFNVKTCRHWYSMRSLPDGMLPDATLPPNTDHTYAQWLERVEAPRSPQPSPFKRRTATPVKKYIPIDEEDYELGQLFEGDDERKCMFCHIFGDQESNDAGRLLYCGQDDWCHVNCALWSAEVYEDADGELQNLVEAFSRAKLLRCDLCGKSGATVGCNTKGCKANYHFMCARRDQCRFQEDKKVFCKMHRMYIDAELLTGDRFNVLRRAYVGTLYVRSVKKRWSKGLHCGDVSVLMGSCCVEGLGRLTDLSDKPKFLQPVDFISTRMYWSTKDARRRCVYTCRIVEVRPEMLKSPTVTIKDMRIVHDQDHPDYVPISNLDITGINSVSEQQLSICGTDSENPFVDLTTDTTDLTANTADLTANTADLTANTADLTGNSADLTSNQSANNCNLSETLSAEEQTMDIVCDKSQFSGLSLNRRTDIGDCKTVQASSHRRASFSGMPSERKVYKDSDKLSMSWPCSNAKPASEKPIQTNLSFLSPNTLKMLNIKDPSKFVKPVENTEQDQEEFSLLKVADRLNRAAAKCSRQKSEERSSPLLNRSEGNSPLPFRAHSRSPSVERVGSPMLTRPFSPIVGIRQMSQSGDRNTEVKPFQQSLSLQNKFSSLLASLPEKSFTPPARMLARSKSLSIDREFSASKFSNITSVTGKNEPFLPPVQSDSPMCLRRGRSVSDPVDVMPKPVSFSSPVANKADMVESKKFVLSDISTDNEESENFTPSSHNSTKTFGTESQVMETETELNECSEITEAENRSSEMITESECTDSSQNNGTIDEATETIIVMTESGESLSEEDAIKIVQDMIEQRNTSLETEDQDQSAEIEEDKQTDTDNNLDCNSGAESENVKDECVDTEIQNNGHPDSPFIPQIENESIGNERVRRNTGDKTAGETADNSDTTENEETSHESQVDSNDVLDKDDNATEDASLDSKKNEEVDMILIDTCSDTDSDNDIIDITDSVVNAGTVNQESESDKNEIPEVQPETNLSNAKVEEDAMKRIVYDLDESIDSDIEVLDDLDMTDKEESNSPMSCENINANEHKSADEIKDSEIFDSAPIECSSNVLQTGSTCKDDVLVKAPLNNKTCLNEDEIDGDTAKTTSKIKEDIKQTVHTQSRKVESENVEEKNEISVSSNEKAATCISQSPKYAQEKENSKVGISEDAIVDNALVDIELTEGNALVDVELTEDNALVDMELTEDNALVDKELTEDNALVDAELTEDNALVDVELTEDNALVDKELTEDNASVDEESTEDNALVDAELTEDNALVDAELTEDNALVDRKLTKDNALVDMELTEDNALEDKELTEMKNCDENLDSSKEEVLRGLGLGTLDEVERLKNSPQKSPCFPVLTPEVKKKFSKKLPVKSYPLRNNMASPARLRNDDVAKVNSRNEKKNSVNEFEDPFKGMNEKSSTERGTAPDVKELNQEIYKELSPELPVLDPIAKKIKEESIAKSCPEEKGPFKCSKCRRQYRTETSYLVHAENCNFLVSSSDDEDTNQDDEDSKVKTKSKELRSTRSRTKSLIEEKVQKKESICSSDDNTDNKRTTLRRSTQYQRVAIEVEKRQQEEENPKRGRGRPPFKSRDSLESDKDKHQKELMSKETFASKTGDPRSSENLDNVKKGRGRPRKSEIMYKSMEGESEDTEFIEEKVSVRETRRKSREAKLLENLSQSSDSEIEETHDKNAVVVKRKRGRPKKLDTSTEVVKHDSSEEEPPVAKQKLRKDDIEIEKHSSKENCHDMKDSCSNFKQVKADLKSQIENIRTSRYRPAKMVHMKTRNKTIRIYVKDSKKLKDRNNKFGLKAVSVRLQKTDYLHRNKDLIKADKMYNHVGKSTSNDTGYLNEKNCLTETPKPRGRGRPPLQRNASVEDEHDVEELEGCEKLNVSHKEEIAKGKRLESQFVKSKTLTENKINENSEEDKSSSCKQDQNIERKEDMSVNTEDDSDNDIDMDVDQKQESSDEGNSILDESTGWIVDKKSGEMIRSPTQKKSNDNCFESENSKDEKDIEDEKLDEINNTNTKEKCHTVETCSTVEHGAEYKEDNLNVNEEKVQNVNAEGGKDEENKDTTRFSSPQLEENMFDENECVTEMEVEKKTGNSNNENREKLVENSSENRTLELQKSVDAEVKKGTDPPKAAEVKAVSEQGAIQSMEFKDATDNLPNTVLKLLKDGHKVVIRNPKLNKCFMWQKTADGYIGKPFDKKLAKSPSVSEKNEASRQNSSETDSSGSNGISENTTDSQVSNARLKTASDILRERKKSDVEQTPLKQGLDTSVGQYIEKLTEKPEILKRKAKFVVENIERLIETNKKAKARALVPERLPRGSAEYVGGILISPPKSVSVDEVKHTIKSTAPIATNMLQNTLLQNKLINNYQGGVQNFSSSAVQSALQSPVSIATQSGYPALQQQLQTGSMRMFTQTDLQTVTQTALQPYPQVTPQNIVPAGYSSISMNSLQSLSPVSPQYTSQVVPSPVIQQTYRPSQVVPSSVIQQAYQPVQVQQVQQIPSLEMGVINVPLITSVGFSNAQLVQTMGTINPNAAHPFLNTNSQQSYVNTPSSTSLIVNSQISQPLINAHTTQTLLNQYMTQTLLSPQASQTMGNQFVSQSQTVVNQLPSRPRTINQFSAQPQTIINQLSPQPQTSVVNQLGSQQQIAQSSVNQEPSQPQVSQAVVSQQSIPQCSFAQPRPIYNQTQIVNRTSGTKVSYQTNVPKTVLDIDQTVIDRQTVYSVLKQKLSSHPEVKDSDSDTKNSAPYFKVFPGLGGGTNSLIKKMHTYISSKHKLPPSLTPSPTHKRIKPYSAAAGDSNGIIQTKQPTSADPKVVYISPNKQKVKKHLTRKSKLKREMSPRKWTRPYRKKNPTPKVASGIAVPHKTDKASHPMIHGPKEVTSLPVAAVEEEVRDVPLSALDDNDSRQSGVDGTGQNRGHLEYEISSDDGFSCRSDTLEGAWKQVTEKVQDARTASRLKHLSYAGLSGLQMFGLSHPSVVYLVEQLYGASYCRRYKFKYHRHEMVERELELVNPTGCIRTEPFSGRNPSDMFSFLMSRYRTLPEYCDRYVNEEIAMKSSRRATSMDLPMAMRFRKLKGFSKECVGVYRSTIHGRGLFCKRSIDAGEMIIEYAGEVIRNSMTDIREKYYESKGIGCYMFRIDDTDVVDATMRGSAARFINHSCDPNCYSKVITVDNRKHIVIFAMRKILRGEELTYDYKFPIEEIKIPCTCGAKKCRRYLN